MTSIFSKAALVPVAASFAFAIAMASSAPASAQAALTNGPNGMQPNTLNSNNKAAQPSRRYAYRRPLTVRRAVAAPVEAAAAPVAPVVAPAANIVSAPLGAANSLVGLPFTVLGGIFPNVDSVRVGGVTDVPYENQRPKVAEIDEGWAMAVPVNKSGPVYVVKNGDPTISPLTLVGGGIRGFGTVAQTPLRVIGTPFGGGAPLF